MGSIFDSNGGADRDINNRVKDKVYKTVIKPTITYGAECWAVRKKDENRLHVAEMRILRWIRGKTRKDHVRNQIIRADAKLCQMSTIPRQNDYIGTKYELTADKTENSQYSKMMLKTGRQRSGDGL